MSGGSEEERHWWRPGGPSIAKHPGRLPGASAEARSQYQAAAASFVVHHTNVAANGGRQLMLKAKSNAATLTRARALVSYITDKGKLAAKNEHGFYEDRSLWEETLENWSAEFREAPKDSTQPPPRNVGHFIVSAPAGTDVVRFEGAVSDWLQQSFAENYNYLSVVHDNTDNPHVHVALHRNGHDGKALHMDKGDIERWRERCAAVCREHGLAIDASRQYERGVVQHSIPQAIHHMIERGEKVDTRVKALAVDGSLNARERAHVARILHAAKMHKLAAELYREQSKRANPQGKARLDKQVIYRLEGHSERLESITDRGNTPDRRQSTEIER